MRATKLLFTFIFFMFVTMPFQRAFAYDETWGIFQFRKKMESGQQIFAEYVRRDRGQVFELKNLDLLRLSYGVRIEDSSWGFLVGGAFVDFETGGDERRLHQFAIFNRTYENIVSLSGRFGIEQRQFNGDDNIYWRVRNRLMMNPFPQHPFGISVYGEILYAADGRARFATGLNEDRFGVGLRYHTEGFEMMLYHTAAHLKTLRREDRVEWLQLQSILSF